MLPSEILLWPTTRLQSVNLFSAVFFPILEKIEIDNYKNQPIEAPSLQENTKQNLTLLFSNNRSHSSRYGLFVSAL